MYAIAHAHCGGDLWSPSALPCLQCELVALTTGRYASCRGGEDEGVDEFL